MKAIEDEFGASTDYQAERRRRRTVERVQLWLEDVGRPRLLMTAIMTLTWAAWFFSSAGLRWLGVRSMGLRYPMAVGIAYLAFLGMLWVWLRGMMAVGATDDAVEHQAATEPLAATVGAAMAGAAGLAISPPTARRQKAAQATNAASYTPNLDGFGGDLGEGWVLVLGLALLLSALVLSGWVIVTAPVLLAELVVDGLAMVAVSRSVRRASAPHWSSGVVRRTWLATALTAVLFSVIGFGLRYAAPEASTFAEVWRSTYQSKGAH
jgi:hypothetical protein